VNRPVSPVQHYHRDGAGRTDANGAGAPNYHPNNFDGVVEHSQRTRPSVGSGDVFRYDHRSDEDYYSQAGDLYRLMNADQRTLLVDNIVTAMRSVPQSIKDRQVAHFIKADGEYGARIRDGLAKIPGGDPLKVPVTK
jgi:catalase